MNGSDGIKQELDRVSKVINEADTQIRQGTMIDLAGLDTDISNLCDRVLTLPPPEAASIKPVLQTMIERLDSLQAALQEFQNKKSGEMDAQPDD